MINYDKKLFEIGCRKFLMKVVQNSTIINEKITFEQKVILYDEIKKMPFKKLFNLLFRESREIETKDEKEFKYGAAITGGALGTNLIAKKSLSKSFGRGKAMMVGAALGAGLLFLYRKLTDPCLKDVAGIYNPRKRQLAKLNCENQAIMRVIPQIRSSIANCVNAPNPEYCKDKMSVQLNKWREKYENNLVQISKLRSSQDYK